MEGDPEKDCSWLLLNQVSHWEGQKGLNKTFRNNSPLFVFSKHEIEF